MPIYEGNWQYIRQYQPHMLGQRDSFRVGHDQILILNLGRVYLPEFIWQIRSYLPNEFGQIWTDLPDGFPFSANACSLEPYINWLLQSLYYCTSISDRFTTKINWRNFLLLFFTFKITSHSSNVLKTPWNIYWLLEFVR